MKNVQKQMNQLKETAQNVNDYAFKAFLYARRLGDSNANVNYATEKNIKFCISQIVHHCNAIFRILL
jgi:hypothetical protein